MELGALLWAIEMEGKGYHRLGYGKPLGFGSATVTVNKGQILNVKARYSTFAEMGYEPLEDRTVVIRQFRDAAQTEWGVPFEELEPIRDLIALVGKQEPSLPVHYPFVADPDSPDRTKPDPKSQGSFEWFVGNKSNKGPKIEMGSATEDKGLPFINRKGEIY